jgi:hypothetical protein
VHFLEIRPFPPIGTGDDVHFAVFVEISKVRALAPKAIAQLSFLKRVNGVIRGRKGTGENSATKPGKQRGGFDHPLSVARRTMAVKRRERVDRMAAGGRPRPQPFKNKNARSRLLDSGPGTAKMRSMLGVRTPVLSGHLLFGAGCATD